MGITQREYYVLSKMKHTSKKNGNQFLKVTYIDTNNFIESSKDSKFIGYIVNDLYCDISLYDKVTPGGVNIFDYDLGDFGTQLRVTDIIG